MVWADKDYVLKKAYKDPSLLKTYEAAEFNIGFWRAYNDDMADFDAGPKERDPTKMHESTEADLQARHLKRIANKPSALRAVHELETADKAITLGIERTKEAGVFEILPIVMLQMRWETREAAKQLKGVSEKERNIVDTDTLETAKEIAEGAMALLLRAEILRIEKNDKSAMVALQRAKERFRKAADEFKELHKSGQIPPILTEVSYRAGERAVDEIIKKY